MKEFQYQSSLILRLIFQTKGSKGFKNCTKYRAGMLGEIGEGIGEKKGHGHKQQYGDYQREEGMGAGGRE